MSQKNLNFLLRIIFSGLVTYLTTIHYKPGHICDLNRNQMKIQPINQSITKILKIHVLQKEKHIPMYVVPELINFHFINWICFLIIHLDIKYFVLYTNLKSR